MKTVALRKIGNSQGILLDKTLLDLAGAEPDSAVFEVKVNDGEILLKPLSRKQQKDLIRKASSEISKEQQPILKKLAE